MPPPAINASKPPATFAKPAFMMKGRSSGGNPAVAPGTSSGMTYGQSTSNVSETRQVPPLESTSAVRTS